MQATLLPDISQNFRTIQSTYHQILQISRTSNQLINYLTNQPTNQPTK